MKYDSESLPIACCSHALTILLAFVGRQTLRHINNGAIKCNNIFSFDRCVRHIIRFYGLNVKRMFRNHEEWILKLTSNIRKTNLYVLSPFGTTVWKSTGNVIVVHLSASSSSSSVSALNKPGIPSKSSTCDWRDTFLVSAGFGHISESTNRFIDSFVLNLANSQHT